MASSPWATKQWSLSKNESINSFENLRQNLVYTLSLDSNFTRSHFGEELAPTLENFIVLTWLKLIHPELIPSKLVKQRYRTELKSRILASIEP